MLSLISFSHRIHFVKCIPQSFFMDSFSPSSFFIPLDKSVCKIFLSAQENHHSNWPIDRPTDWPTDRLTNRLTKDVSDDLKNNLGDPCRMHAHEEWFGRADERANGRANIQLYMHTRDQTNKHVSELMSQYKVMPDHDDHVMILLHCDLD